MMEKSIHLIFDYELTFDLDDRPELAGLSEASWRAEALHSFTNTSYRDIGENSRLIGVLTEREWQTLKESDVVINTEGFQESYR